MREPQLVTVLLHGSTKAILDEVAASWNMSVEEAICNVLYRDAAAMSGWPGALGSQLRHTLVDSLVGEPPDTDAWLDGDEDSP